MLPRKTLILKFSRHGSILSTELHPDWDSAAASVMSIAYGCFKTMDSAVLEQLLSEWDDDLGPMTWSDGEYEIVLDSKESKYSRSENLEAQVLKFTSR